MQPSRSSRSSVPGQGVRSRGLRFAVVAVATVLALAVVPSSQARVTDGAGAVPDQFTPLAASVLAAPHPVPGADGRTHLAYELLLVNPTQASVRVDRLEVLDAGRPDRALADLAGTALDGVLASITGAPGRAVGAGQVSRALLDVATGRYVPRALVHRLTVTLTPPEPALPSRFLAARTAVAPDRPVVLGPPLQGRGWMHLSGCCAPGAHRNAVSPINGGLYAAQRFAVDITQLTADGRLFDGPPGQVTSFPAYGTPVLAGADGVVVAVRDDLPDQIPFQPTPPTSARDVLGNHVVVRVDAHRYVFSGHLKPGSVRVAAGDRVRRGQQLGQVGNSGNSDLPHLHIHVMAGPSPLGSDGLPFVLRSFDSPGSVPPLDEIDVTRPIPVSAELRGHHERVSPMDRQVVDYPPAG